MAKPTVPTKAELQQLADQYEERLDRVAEKVDELVNPILTREQIVEGLQELDQLLTDEDDEDEEDADDEEDEEEESFL